MYTARFGVKMQNAAKTEKQLCSLGVLFSRESMVVEQKVANSAVSLALK